MSWFDLSDYFIPLATIGKQRNIPAALNLVALEYLDKEDNTKLPYEPSTALEYFRRALKILQDDLNFHSSVSYPLVKIMVIANINKIYKIFILALLSATRH